MRWVQWIRFVKKEVKGMTAIEAANATVEIASLNGKSGGGSQNTNTSNNNNGKTNSSKVRLKLKNEI